MQLNVFQWMQLNELMINFKFWDLPSYTAQVGNIRVGSTWENLKWSVAICGQGGGSVELGWHKTGSFGQPQKDIWPTERKCYQTFSCFILLHICAPLNLLCRNDQFTVPYRTTWRLNWCLAEAKWWVSCRGGAVQIGEGGHQCQTKNYWF